MADSLMVVPGRFLCTYRLYSKDPVGISSDSRSEFDHVIVYAQSADQAWDNAWWKIKEKLCRYSQAFDFEPWDCSLLSRELVLKPVSVVARAPSGYSFRQQKKSIVLDGPDLGGLFEPTLSIHKWGKGGYYIYFRGLTLSYSDLASAKSMLLACWFSDSDGFKGVL